MTPTSTRPKSAAGGAVPGVVTPKGRRTRERIVAAGRHILEIDGYFASSIASITAASGIALGTFYRYSRNKEELFLEVLADLVEEMRAAAGSAWGDGDDPLSSLRAASLRYIEGYHANRRLIAALEQMAAVVPECARLWLELRTGTYEAMGRHLRRARPAPELDAALAAAALGGMVEEFARHWFVDAERAGQRVPTVSEAAETVAQIWYRAIYEER